MDQLIADMQRLREDVDRIMRALAGKGVPMPDPMHSLMDRMNAIEKDVAELQAVTASAPK